MRCVAGFVRRLRPGGFQRARPPVLYRLVFPRRLGTRPVSSQMAGQRAAFAQALRWVYGELVPQRAEEPVAFLAQLGRDHRKYGVLPAIRHVAPLPVCDAAQSSWPRRGPRPSKPPRSVAEPDHRGDERRSRRRRGTRLVGRHGRRTHSGVADLAVLRLRLDHPMHYHAGQYVNVQVPQCPRRWRYLSPAIPANPDGGIEFHVRVVPGGLVSTAVVNETRPGDRWRLSVRGRHAGRPRRRGRADGGRQHRAGAVAGADHGPQPLRANPRVHLFFGARYRCELYDLRTLWHVAAHNPWLSVSPVSEYSARPVLGGRLPRRHTTARSASYTKPAGCPRW